MSEIKPLKNIELKLIAELMINSRRSDRELAKAIGVSQPTVTRLRTKLEKEKPSENTRRYLTSKDSDTK